MGQVCGKQPTSGGVPRERGQTRQGAHRPASAGSVIPGSRGLQPHGGADALQLTLVPRSGFGKRLWEGIQKPPVMWIGADVSDNPAWRCTETQCSYSVQ
jgi:hypothetical protein